MPSSASEVDDYANAVHRALSLVQFGERGDQPSVDQAIAQMEQLPGAQQSEILHDLRATPPKLADADQRLQALYAGLQQHVDTPDAQRAQQQLTGVLSMPRYAGLSTGPSLIGRVLQAVFDALRRFFSWLGVGSLNLDVPLWIWFALAGLIVLGIILWPLRTAIIWGGRQARGSSGPAPVRPSMDFFAQADRLAAGGDYVGAIRALAGGVATRLNGERAWQQSPFTVRELFSNSRDSESLRPLLRLFEEASYGYRRPDAPTYARAAEVAEPYRRSAA